MARYLETVKTKLSNYTHTKGKQLSNQISSIDLVEEVMSDPIAITYVHDHNIRIEVRPDSCYEQYEVALFNCNEDSVIRLFVVNKFDHAMQKLHDLTVAFADRD